MTTWPPFVQRCFDHRRDPFDDAAVQQWLLAHPDQLAPLAALRVRLAAVGTLPRRPLARSRPGRTRRWPWVALAATAALAVVGLAFVGGVGAEEAMPRPAVDTRTRVRAAGVCTSTIGADASCRHEIVRGRATLTLALRHTPSRHVRASASTLVVQGSP